MNNDPDLKLPLPNEVIDLKEIYNLKFFRTSYREYLGVYGDYIIGVYPFAILVENAYKDNKPITYDHFKMCGVRSSHHHQDYVNKKINTDPCDVYESISGTKIHRGVSDRHLMNIDHIDDIKLFEVDILSQKRDNKLTDILHERG